MNTNAEILSQVKGECVSCDKEKETHELCMDCMKKKIEECKLDFYKKLYRKLERILNRELLVEDYHKEVKAKIYELAKENS